jgi:hypothetical protein
LGYLAGPWFLFVTGWLRWPYAAAGVFCLIVLLWLVTTFLPKEIPPLRSGERLRQGLFGIAALALMLLAGAGEFVAQVPDWHRNHILLRDLTSMPWPVVYPDQTTLVYYFAAYLPAGLVGKLALAFGAPIETAFFCSRMAFWLWLSGGLFLAMEGFSLFCQSRWAGLTLFPWFGGFTVLAGLESPLTGYPCGLSYPSVLVNLTWAAPHALAAWLATALFLSFLSSPSSLRLWSLGLALGAIGLWSALHSALVTLGLVPLAFLVLGYRGLSGKLGRPPHGVALAPEISLLALSVLLVIFYLSKNPHGWGTTYADGSSSLSWTFRRPDFTWGLYVRFLLCEVLPWAGMILWAGRMTGRQLYPVLLMGLMLELFLIPLIHLGYHNDFCQRVSMAPCFVLWILAVQSWGQVRNATPLGHRVYTWVFLLLLALSGGKAVVQAGQTVMRTRAFGAPDVRFDQTPSLPDYDGHPMHEGYWSAWFFQHLARDNRITPTQPGKNETSRE